MRWQGRRGSGNIEDRRRMGPGGVTVAGGGLVGVVVIIIILCLGGDPRMLVQQGQNAPQGQQAPAEIDPKTDELAGFVSVVLADTEDVWQDLFQQNGDTYRDPTLVLFRDRVSSACGYGSAATGPFYCPADSKVYIDLTFFDELDRGLGAGGDFARAYVVAHEVGHHVQNLLGISDRVHRAQQSSGSKETANELSVRLELQADYLAGVWAHHAEKNWQILEEGDIQEALDAATAIGDDRLQRQSQGYVVPESFTHGTSEQRARWFMRGLRSGRLSGGDALFEADYSEL